MENLIIQAGEYCFRMNPTDNIWHLWEDLEWSYTMNDRYEFSIRYKIDNAEEEETKLYIYYGGSYYRIGVTDGRYIYSIDNTFSAPFYNFGWLGGEYNLNNNLQGLFCDRYINILESYTCTNQAEYNFLNAVLLPLEENNLLNIEGLNEVVEKIEELTPLFLTYFNSKVDQGGSLIRSSSSGVQEVKSTMLKNYKFLTIRASCDYSASPVLITSTSIAIDNNIDSTDGIQFQVCDTSKWALWKITNTGITRILGNENSRIYEVIGYK